MISQYPTLAAKDAGRTAFDTLDVLQTISRTG